MIDDRTPQEISADAGMDKALTSVATPKPKRTYTKRKIRRHPGHVAPQLARDLGLDLWTRIVQEYGLRGPEPLRDAELTEWQYLHILHALVLAEGPTMAVELGTGSGISTLAIASALPDDGHLLTVDTADQREAMGKVIKWGLTPKVQFAKAEGIRALSGYSGHRFGFAYLDTGVGTIPSEFELLRQKISEKALVVLHQTSPYLPARSPVYLQMLDNLPGTPFQLGRGLRVLRMP